MKPRVLVMGADAGARTRLDLLLRSGNFEPAFAGTEVSASFVVEQLNPGLVLLAGSGPALSSGKLCQALRTAYYAPLIVLSAQAETRQIVFALRSGADDYVTTPFIAEELIARIRAQLRGRDKSAKALRIGPADDPVTVEVPARRVERGGQVVALTRLEFELLAAFAREPDRIFTRETLMKQVWGYCHAIDTGLVKVHVRRLRAKVERDLSNPAVVVTVPGIGYRAGNSAAPASFVGSDEPSRLAV